MRTILRRRTYCSVRMSWRANWHLAAAAIARGRWLNKQIWTNVVTQQTKTKSEDKRRLFGEGHAPIIAPWELWLGLLIHLNKLRHCNTLPNWNVDWVLNGGRAVWTKGDISWNQTRFGSGRQTCKLAFVRAILWSGYIYTWWISIVSERLTKDDLPECKCNVSEWNQTGLSLRQNSSCKVWRSLGWRMHKQYCRTTWSSITYNNVPTNTKRIWRRCQCWFGRKSFSIDRRKVLEKILGKTMKLE